MQERFDDNEDAVIDRLVDGELSPTERQELLSALDEREDGWRKCALAFLEAQSWGQEFRQFVGDSADAESVVTSTTHSEKVDGRASRYLSLAAGLLVAFAIGWLVRSPNPTQPADQQLATTGRQETAPDDELSSGDVVTLLVRDASGQDQRLRVPLVDGGRLDKQFGLAGASLPPRMRATLQDRGLDLQRRRRYAPMFFEQDDRLLPMVVPVEDTYVVPVSRPVY